MKWNKLLRQTEKRKTDKLLISHIIYVSVSKHTLDSLSETNKLQQQQQKRVTEEYCRDV